MHFKVDLSRIERLPELPVDYDEALDDVRSILSDVCDALADTALAEFTVSGFGQDRWPVDVRTDLAVLLEQLPEAAAALESGAPFELDFSEQGVERTVRFAPRGNQCSARCESRTAWTPNPEVETVERQALKAMLDDVRDELVRCLTRTAPRTLAHPWMRAWVGVRDG